MKRVLFVATVVKTHINTFHLPYLKWFKEQGYETHVCAKNDFDVKEDCFIPYCDYFHEISIERSPFSLNNLKAYNEIKDILRENDFEIIHCHTPMGGALTRIVSHNMKLTNTKVIYTAHGFHFYKGAPIKNWLLYYPVEKILSRYTDILITINKEDYNRAERFKASKLVYVPGVGININQTKNIKINPVNIRKSIGVANEEFMIISVGELNENKNHQIIIRAIAKSKNESIKYVVCGQGLLEKRLRKLAKDYGVEQQIIFLGYRDDIPLLMSVADLFAFPSIREGLSLSLMEAMASGLPVICSEIRGNTDLITDGDGGYLVAPNDIDLITQYIKRLAADSKLRDSFSVNNLKNIKKYSLENVLSEMEKIYLCDDR